MLTESFEKLPKERQEAIKVSAKQALKLWAEEKNTAAGYNILRYVSMGIYGVK